MRGASAGLALLSLIVLTAAPARAVENATIGAGLDLWVTPAGSGTMTHLDINSNVFGTGSDAVHKDIDLKGVPLDIKLGTASLAPADTALERLDTAYLSVCGSPDTVGLRIAALHLVSESDLVVTYSGVSPEPWKVDVYLSDSPQEEGTLELWQKCDDGGTFESHFTVRPKIVFTPPSGSGKSPLTLDYSSGAVPAVSFSGSGDWARRSPEGFTKLTVAAGALVDANNNGTWNDDTALPATTADFVVGVKAQPCSCSASLARASESSTYTLSPAEEAALAASHLPQPAPCEDGKSLPLHGRDKGKRERPSDGSGQSASFLLHYLPVGLILAAAVLSVPWPRRKRMDGEEPPES
jgi:hypothetical protein